MLSPEEDMCECSGGQLCTTSKCRPRRCALFFPQIYTMSRDLTAKWLRQQTPAYRNADRVYVDVLSALDSCSSLRPKTDVYSKYGSQSA